MELGSCRVAGKAGSVNAVRTLERGYYTPGRRAGQVRRLHVIREDGPRGWEPGKQALCGTAAWLHRNSPPILRDAPHPLPEGLSWCPRCVGLLAELEGRTAEIAALLGLAPGGAP